LAAPTKALDQEPQAHIQLGDAMDMYESWPAPTVIVVDGPYGVAGFPGDPPTPDGLAEWYAPHVAEWARLALPSATLWFWGTEVGWASVHPVLALHGWQYATANVWDKGIGHVAGNVNGKTIRQFPVVSEMCVRYTRNVTLPAEDGTQLPLPQWLRAEWARAGLPLYKTNEACGVANAATRKYFTLDHLWYFPPPEMMERLVAYASKHGRLTRRPYFSLDGHTPLTGDAWSALRSKWHHEHAVTNVWREPALRGVERLKKPGGGHKCVHTNQKPLKLMERIVAASSDPGDVVWEPFGGLCTASLAAVRLGRDAYAAEIDADFHRMATDRLATAWETGSLIPE
jgi:site-specific DNA-methyltransferase (adenine-specific)